MKNLLGGKFEGIRQKYKNGTNGQDLPFEFFDKPTQDRLVHQRLLSAPVPALAPAAAAPGAAPVAPAIHPAVVDALGKKWGF